MGGWAATLWETVTGTGAGKRVRRALEVARRDRALVTLVTVPPVTAVPVTMETRIEQVRDDDIIIGQPITEGNVRQLASGEALRMSFSAPGIGYLSGRTKVLGRYKTTSGDDTPFYGYRLSIPETLTRGDRRQAPRVPVFFDLARETEIYKLDDESPVRGVVQNLSTGGMQVRTRSKRPLLTRGERVRLVVYLPEPVGKVDRVVTISHVGVDQDPRFRTLGLEFGRQLRGMAELIEELQNRQAARRAG